MKKTNAASSKNANSKTTTTASSTNPTSAASTTPLVAKQPQSKQQAAVSAGVFLYADDAWSQAYFDKNDLHYIERVLFG